MREQGDSRAWVTFLNGGDEGERTRIEEVLGARFHDGRMVGRVDVQMATEPEGWRVVRAGHIESGALEPPTKSDFRPQVIDALRTGGIAVTNP